MPFVSSVILGTFMIFIAAAWIRSQFVYDAIFVCTGQRTWTLYPRSSGVQFLEIDWDLSPLFYHEQRPAKRVHYYDVTELDYEIRGVRRSILGIVLIYNAHIHDEDRTSCRGIIIPYPWLMAVPTTMLCLILTPLVRRRVHRIFPG
jgi:hypothetical protein